MTAGFGLGTVTHEISFGGQTDHPPVIDGWESVESAPGGYQSMAGQIDAARVLTLPHIYRQGAVWCAYLKETGECIGKGTLLPPAISGGVAQLVARGLAFKADRQVGRLLYANRAYADWAPADSDPFNIANGQWNYDTNGRLAVTIPPNTDLTTGLNGGFVFAAQSGDPSSDPNSLTRIAFTMHGTGDFEWRLYMYSFPNTPNAGNPEPTTFPCVDGNTVDYTFTLDGDMVFLRLHSNTTRAWRGEWSNANDYAVNDCVTYKSTAYICVLAHVVAHQPPNATYWTSLGAANLPMVYSVTNLEIDGVATSASFSADQVISDIAGRLGFSDAFVQSSADSVMPIDQKQGTFADVCDWVDTLTGRRTLWTSFNGQVDVCDSGPWETRTWYMLDPEAPFTPLPSEIFDTVRIPFRYGPGSSATGLLTVTMKDSPLPEPNVFGDVAIGTPVADATIAETLGNACLAMLSIPRMSGSGVLAEVGDSTGARVSAHTMRAGDILFTLGPDSASLPIRIASVTRKADGVSWQGDNRIAALDRLIARRAEALGMGGMGGSG